MSNDTGPSHTTPTISKVRADHLKRHAIVYIRQSTIKQVETNLESKRRQYALVDRARSLGWSDTQIEVIDEDQGKSAARTDGRHGFARLVTKIGMGEVGIILGLEVSRLARNNKDWYHLLDLCAIFNTLIADNDGIYNLQSFNDRLLLGLKGTMSEAELHIMRNRLNAGLENKARRGELILGLPIGFCISENREIELDPNELVRHTINTVFEKFQTYGSVHAVFRSFSDEGILFPYRKDVLGRKGANWASTTYRAIYSLLTNPLYAGAYSFGRTTTTQKVTENGRIRKHRGKLLDRSRWPILIIDHHPGYITWREYEENQKRIEANRQGFCSPGPVKGGSSLLSGLLQCAVCGRSMHITYSGTKGNCPRFMCIGNRLRKAGDKCQSFGSRRLEKEITTLLLSVLEPQSIEATLMALENFEKQRVGQIRRLNLDVERAIHIEDLARRRFERVEPENRLVARELEKKWEKALMDLKETKRVKERKMASLPPPLTEEEKNEIRKILGHLPKLWESPTTKPEDRKEITRLLIHHIEVHVDKSQRRLHYAVHWVMGQVTIDNVKLPRTGEHRWTTPDTDLDMIRNLAQDHTDTEIAIKLTQFGRKTPHGLPWTEVRVSSVRMAHKIKKPKRRPENLITCAETRQILNIDYNKFRELVIQKKLNATQAYPNTRWRVPREEVEKLVSQLRKKS